jgi:hypothetical protein
MYKKLFGMSYSHKVFSEHMAEIKIVQIIGDVRKKLSQNDLFSIPKPIE